MLVTSGMMVTAWAVARPSAIPGHGYKYPPARVTTSKPRSPVAMKGLKQGVLTHVMAIWQVHGHLFVLTSDPTCLSSGKLLHKVQLQLLYRDATAFQTCKMLRRQILNGNWRG